MAVTETMGTIKLCIIRVFFRIINPPCPPFSKGGWGGNAVDTGLCSSFRQSLPRHGSPGDCRNPEAMEGGLDSPPCVLDTGNPCRYDGCVNSIGLGGFSETAPVCASWTGWSLVRTVSALGYDQVNSQLDNCHGFNG